MKNDFALYLQRREPSTEFGENSGLLFSMILGTPKSRRYNFQTQNRERCNLYYRNGVQNGPELCLAIILFVVVIVAVVNVIFIDVVVVIVVLVVVIVIILLLMVDIILGEVSFRFDNPPTDERCCYQRMD